MLQLLVYAVLARQGQRSVYFVWLTLVALVVGGLQANSLEALLIWVSAIDAVLFAVLLGLSLWLVNEPAPESAEKTTAGRRRGAGWAEWTPGSVKGLGRGARSGAQPPPTPSGRRAAPAPGVRLDRTAPPDTPRDTLLSTS